MTSEILEEKTSESETHQRSVYEGVTEERVWEETSHDHDRSPVEDYLESEGCVLARGDIE